MHIHRHYKCLHQLVGYIYIVLLDECKHQWHVNLPDIRSQSQTACIDATILLRVFRIKCTHTTVHVHVKHNGRAHKHTKSDRDIHVHVYMCMYTYIVYVHVHLAIHDYGSLHLIANNRLPIEHCASDIVGTGL